MTGDHRQPCQQWVRTLLDNDNSWLCAARGTKIHSSDPPLPAVCTAYETPPFLSVFHPPIELTSQRPRSCLDLDGWVD
jgi:hypothetical protein